MFKVTKIFKYTFTLSALLVILSVVATGFWGLNLGIDFLGGSLVELRLENKADITEVRERLSGGGFKDIVVQSIDENTIIVKSQALHPEEKQKFEEIIQTNFGNFEELRFDLIGPTIGKELRNDAYWQIALVIIAIILYIAYAFRRIGKVSKDAHLSAWKLGFATIIALIHDIVITIGAFAVLGRFFNVEVDTMFITALLTILGFSVHDTIVVFDRIRENLEKYKYKSLAVIIDYSVTSTIARSINTSSTLIFVLLALLFFGGQTIYFFVLALLIGVVAGTYSSIFLASPLLYLWQKEK